MKKAVSLVLLLAVALSLCACGGSASTAGEKHADYAMYIKDSELYFNDLKNGSVQLTSRLLEDGDMEESDFEKYEKLFSGYIYVSPDGKLAVYPDKIGDDDGFSIYYSHIDNGKAEQGKIDSNIATYTVNTDGTMVTYSKYVDGEETIYRYSLKDDSKEKIASNIKGFDVSEDGTKLFYVSEEGALYTLFDGKEKEKLVGSISEVVYYTDDLSTFYYIKDEALYKHTVGADKEKIDSDVYKALKVYDSGEIYYLKNKSDGEAVTFLDVINDDMKQHDLDITKGKTAPTKPQSSAYATTEEWNAAYEQYKKDYAEYYAARLRNKVREACADAKLSRGSKYSLCFYNGSESTEVSDSCVAKGYIAAEDSPVLLYTSYDGLGKLKLSELKSEDDLDNFYEKLEDAANTCTDRHVAVGAQDTALERERAVSFRLNESGTLLYYIDGVDDEKQTGDMYCVTIKDGVVGESEMYDSDVYCAYCVWGGDTNIIYCKDHHESNSDLYINKVKTDFDVYTAKVTYDEESGKLYYITDWDSEKELGTLKVYSNGESVKISEDVHDFYPIADGQLLYLYDYSVKYSSGELRLWSKGESKKLDDDVICLISADVRSSLKERDRLKHSFRQMA